MNLMGDILAPITSPNATTTTADEQKQQQQASDNSAGNSTMAAFAGQLSLPTPTQQQGLDNSSITSSSGDIQGHLRRNSMPNPDAISQHITNIISRNSDIVGDYNIWNNRKNSSSTTNGNNNNTNSSASNTKQSTTSTSVGKPDHAMFNHDHHQQHHKSTNNNQSSNRKRWSTSGTSLTTTTCHPSSKINSGASSSNSAIIEPSNFKFNTNNTYINNNNNNNNNNSNLDLSSGSHFSRKLSSGCASRYSSSPYKYQRKFSLNNTLSSNPLHHKPPTATMSHEQLISSNGSSNQTAAATAQNHLLELAKLDSILRGTMTTNLHQEKISTINNTMRQHSDQHMFSEPFLLNRHNTMDQFNINQHQQLLTNRFKPNNMFAGREQLSPRIQNDIDPFSLFQNHIHSNPERMYDSVDCLINEQQTNINPMDRRFSLNTYCTPSAYPNARLDSNIFSDQLTSYALWELVKHRQLNMINQQAGYGLSNQSTESFMSNPQLSNLFNGQKRNNSINSFINSQSYDSINSSSSTNHEQLPTSGQNQPISFGECNFDLHQPSNSFSFDQRRSLKASQEFEEIRDFLNNLQNNNRIPNQQSNDKNISSNITNELGLKNYLENSLNIACNEKTIVDKLASTDDLYRDFSQLNSNLNNQNLDVVNERKLHSDSHSQHPIHCCKLCKTTFKSLDTLMAHQAYYCRLSNSASKITQESIFTCKTNPCSNNDNTTSQKSRRNSSALGELADKVRNVFVTTDMDQPMDLHSTVTSPRRVSKSISPSQLSVKIDNLDSNNINDLQNSMCASPTSSTKNRCSILKQQLLGQSVTSPQSLPPKKRKISEPNLKLAGFNVGHNNATNTSMIHKDLPDACIFRENNEQSSPGQKSSHNFDSISKMKHSNDCCEIDLSNKKNSNTELAKNDEDSLDDDLYGSDINNISKKQCSPTRNTQSTTNNVPSATNGRTIYLERHKLDLTKHLEARRNSEYMAHMLEVSTRINFPDSLQLSTLKSNSELEMSMVDQIG